MKVAWNLFWAACAVTAAIGIGLEWYNGKPAGATVWVLAIVGCLLLAISAVERAFPSLKE
jgi:hypothetical protein